MLKNKPFKGESPMSTELLQQIQPLIQGNPELKTQLVNYLALHNLFYMLTGMYYAIITFQLFNHLFSRNKIELSAKKVFLVIIVILFIASIITYLIIPIIAPDIYLFKLMNQ